MFSFDTKYMERCLQLATYGTGYVAPNPLVGAVIVQNDQIISEGYHRHFGGAHAEPNAIHAVKDKKVLKDSTLYVNLEPCSHYGKTPPCADLIISQGIPRVVVGTLDPNPQVAGRGIKRMQDAGIEVVTDVMTKECRELNKRFFIFQEKKRPYITLKWAQTQDGFVDYIRTDASAKPLIISNEMTKLFVHKLRAANQAILIGTNTAILDNPSLTVRNWSGRNPVRVILDRRKRIPNGNHLFDETIQTIVFTEKTQPDKENLQFITTDFADKHLLENILKKLYELNINSILVEGGSTLLNSFIKQNLWDEAYIEVSPLKIEKGISAPILPALPINQKQYQGHDCLFYKNM